MNKNLIQINKEQTKNMKCVGKAGAASFELCAYQAWKHGVNFQTERTYYVIETPEDEIKKYLPVAVSFWKMKLNGEKNEKRQKNANKK